VQALVDAARHGSVRAAARLISALEDDPTRLPELFVGMADWPQPRLTVGITGSPGVGKSTLVDRLVRAWRGARPDRRIGVIAVDPSSVFTGGAVLGDRIRMMEHSTDPFVFIRSLAARGHLGGLTLGTRGSLRVLGLLGCDIVLVETVGVGQSEIEVAGVADLCVVVLSPGQGDGIQMIKAGLMEAADLFAINKCDKPGADRLHSELTATLSLAAVRHRGRVPPVFRVSAADGAGIEELRSGIEDSAAELDPELRRRRADAIEEEVKQAVLEAARMKLEQALSSNGSLSHNVGRVLKGGASVRELADDMLRQAAHQKG